jgi:DNA-binding helix-hairpin-helix protein with protein kinase domain
MLYDVQMTSRIEKNVVRAFAKIHAHGVCHGDVRPENILVRKNNEVFIIDFENSFAGVERDVLVDEMREVKELLASFKDCDD